jgi:hypothetical protein
MSNKKQEGAMTHQYRKRKTVRTLLTLSVILWVCSSCGGGGGSASPPVQEQVANMPVFTVPEGSYSTDQLIAISCGTPDATIHYTTDGSIPTAGSRIYANPIPVAGQGTILTIKAMAVKPGMLNSDIASATYTISASGVRVLFGYPPSPAGGLLLSSWVSPNGSNGDFYAYEEFTLPSTGFITEVRWRGGYAADAVYGGATDFTITFFATNAAGTEPLVSSPESNEISLARYQVGGNVSVTYAGRVGPDHTMFDYRYQLPTPFQAAGGAKYWLRIQAFQPFFPDWGIAVGTGGDGRHFLYDTGTKTFRFVPNDTSFTLLGN